MSANTLLISDTMIKERTSIHGNIDPKLIYPDIKVAQDMYIHPLLKTALYEKLQTIISNDTINTVPALAAYKALLDNYIVDALVYYTLADLPTTLSYQFWNKGVVRKQGQDTELPSMSELYDVGKKYGHRAEFYANRLKKYLQEKASTLFPEYLNPGNGIDTISGDTDAFTVSVYLGPDHDCDCNEFNNQPYGG